MSDPEVARWLRPKSVSGPYSLQECEAIAGTDAAHWAAHGFGPWLAWDGDACAGRCLLEHSVVAYTRVDNLASRRVMEKLGLVHERDFEHAGYPHVLYRTIRERNSP